MRFVETWRKKATLHIHITAIGESRHLAPCFFAFRLHFQASQRIESTLVVVQNVIYVR